MTRIFKPDSGQDLKLQNNGNTGSVTITDAGDLAIDSPADIILDAEGADITLKDGGTTYGSLKQASGHLVIQPTSSKEIILNDQGGTASLTVDTANQNVSINNGNIVIGTSGKGVDFSAGNPALENSATSESEVLSEYERGYLDFPLYMYTDGSWQACKNAALNSTIRLYYEKIGNIVNVVVQGDFNPPNTVNGGSGTDLSGTTRLYLPFEISKGLTGFTASNSEQVVYFTSAVNSAWSSTSWGWKLIPGSNGANMSNGGLTNYSHVAGQRLTINTRFTYFSN
tara:strand:+ start:18 stop:866 length:849 start_codon:yes stop_codon:yes gene_type:complete